MRHTWRDTVYMGEPLKFRLRQMIGQMHQGILDDGRETSVKYLYRNPFHRQKLPHVAVRNRVLTEQEPSRQ